MSETEEQRKPLRFSEYGEDGQRKPTEAGHALMDWRKTLEDDKRSRAGLRRAANCEDAAMVRGFATLRRELDGLGYRVWGDKAELRLAHVAMIAVEVHPGALQEAVWNRSLGWCLATPERAGRNRVHEARIRLLLGAGDTPQLVRLMRSCLSIVEGIVPLPEMADLVVRWDQPDWRPALRRRVLLDYLDVVLAHGAA